MFMYIPSFKFTRDKNIIIVDAQFQYSARKPLRQMRNFTAYPSREENNQNYKITIVFYLTRRFSYARIFKIILLAQSLVNILNVASDIPLVWNRFVTKVARKPLPPVFPLNMIDQVILSFENFTAFITFVRKICKLILTSVTTHFPTIRMNLSDMIFKSKPGTK